MSPEVEAAIIAGSIGVLTLIGTLAAQFYGIHRTSRDTEETVKKQNDQLDRTLTEQREAVDRTLTEQRAQLDRTLKEQRTRTLNERFATAADRLGGDKPPAIRLAGVYAMAGLADDWPENRQTCVDVLCAYLRLPYEPVPGDAALPMKRIAFQADREVRHTVIRVITAHLTEEAPESWQGMNFDFTGVTFDGGTFRAAKFSGGKVSFADAEFSGGVVSFADAEFSGGFIDFFQAKFSGGTIDFGGAVFSGGSVNFYDTEFSGSAVYFNHTKFSGSAVNFFEARFSGGGVYFLDSEFSGATVGFAGAVFSGSTFNLARAQISSGTVIFGDAVFSGGEVSLRGAGFAGGTVDFKAAKFAGAAVDFSGAKFAGAEVDFSGAGFSAGIISFARAAVSGGTVDFNNAVFSGSTVEFTYAVFSGGTVIFAAMFSGGTVSFNLAKFSGSTVSFIFAEFTGGTVDLSRTADLSHPPDFKEFPDSPPKGAAIATLPRRRTIGPIVPVHCWAAGSALRLAHPKASAGQGELFPARRCYAVFTDSPFVMLQVEAYDRDHAIIEQVSAVGLQRPPGRAAITCSSHRTLALLTSLPGAKLGANGTRH